MFQCIGKHLAICLFYPLSWAFELFAVFVCLSVFVLFLATVNSTAMNLDMPPSAQEKFLQTVVLYTEMVIRYAYIQRYQVK